MKNIPIIEHDSSDFKIEYTGGEYHPHEGESVWFTPYLSMPDMLQLMKLSEAAENESFTVLRDTVAPVLAKVIDHWTWTAVRTNEPLGTQYNGTYYRPTAESIADLSHQEIMYLIDAFFKCTQVKGEANPQPASSEQS
jgi:hypothetical protein